MTCTATLILQGVEFVVLVTGKTAVQLYSHTPFPPATVFFVMHTIAHTFFNSQGNLTLG